MDLLIRRFLVDRDRPEIPSYGYVWHAPFLLPLISGRASPQNTPTLLTDALPFASSLLAICHGAY